MAKLNRILVDKFSIEEAITFETLEENKNNQEFLDSHLIKMENVFVNLPKLEISEKKLEYFLNGVNLTYNFKDGVYNIYNKDKYIGLGIIKNNLLKRDIII
jgi:tRNA U55 pseudouridine synthase TruB